MHKRHPKTITTRGETLIVLWFVVMILLMIAIVVGIICNT